MSEETFPYESHTDTPIPEEVRAEAKKRAEKPAEGTVADVAKTILGDLMT